MRSGVRPIVPSWAESAIEKQPACAAAINSSGLVPLPLSKRVLKEYCVSERTPLSEETIPRPSFSPPVHTADPLRFMSSPYTSSSCASSARSMMKRNRADASLPISSLITRSVTI